MKMKMSDRRIYPDELVHFGILGMKWGKRNGPPYPIADKDHSASEKKAGWRKSLKDKIRDRDDEYRYRQATKRRKQLDGSVPGGMQIRKLGRSQYYIEPVDPSQRRKIYKNGTIVPDYEKASEKKAGWRQSLKAKSQKVRAIKDARKNVSSARDEYGATLQKVNDIRSKTNYEDGVFEKLQRAIYTQSDKDWSKYNKSYNQQLAKNEEYQKLISKLELDKVRLDDLERLSQTKIGSVYFSSMK